MPSIEIDGKQLQVRDGIKIIEAADEAGIYTPPVLLSTAS